MMRLRFYVKSGNVWSEVENITADYFWTDGINIFGHRNGQTINTHCRIGAGRAEFSSEG